MRLGNKGFAFSTMLYGTLSLVIIILMLIFGVLRSSKDETFYYASAIEKKLNTCVDEEIALENCYTSGSGSCDPTSYFACMGISGTSTSARGTIISEKLKENIVTTGNGLYRDSVDLNRFVYRGTNVNNYIKVAGTVWRIIAIEPDGSIKAFTSSYTDNMKWNEVNLDEWDSSSLRDYLTTVVYANITDTGKLSNKIWHIGRIYNIENLDIKALTTQENQEEYSINDSNKGYVGLPNVSDYAKASLNSSCLNRPLEGANCSSWLSSYPSWTMNADGLVTSVTETQKAYRFEGNALISSDVSSSTRIIPVVFLNRTLVITGGDGTAGNPYTVG